VYASRKDLLSTVLALLVNRTKTWSSSSSSSDSEEISWFRDFKTHRKKSQQQFGSQFEGIQYNIPKVPEKHMSDSWLL